MAPPVGPCNSPEGEVHFWGHPGAMDSLPVDVLFSIAQHLPAFAVISCRRVSRSWNRIFRSPHLFRSLAVAAGVSPELLPDSSPEWFTVWLDAARSLPKEYAEHRYCSRFSFANSDADGSQTSSTTRAKLRCLLPYKSASVPWP